MKNGQVYTGETTILVNTVMVSGLSVSGRYAKYSFLEEGREITDLMECDFCRVELCAKIAGIRGEVNFSFL